MRCKIWYTLYNQDVRGHKVHGVKVKGMANRSIPFVLEMGTNRLDQMFLLADSGGMAAPAEEMGATDGVDNKRYVPPRRDNHWCCWVCCDTSSCCHTPWCWVCTPVDLSTCNPGDCNCAI